MEAGSIYQKGIAYMFFPLHDRNSIKHIKFAYVNYSLIAITILAFIVQSSLSQIAENKAIISFGMVPVIINDIVPEPLAWMPEEMTFITYAFLHADWLHLSSNMLFLWIFGDNIEDALGHWRYLIFYLLSAAFAGLAHYYMNLDSSGPLIGASGAVAGVMGAYVLLFPFARLFVLAKIIILIPLAIPAFWMLGVWIATQFLYVLIDSEEAIAWWAHIGGFISGIILAILLKKRDFPIFGGR